MFKFFLKKNACDLWDNLFHFVFVNFIIFVVSIACLALCVFASSFNSVYIIRTVCLACGILISSIILCTFIIAQGDNSLMTAGFETPSFSNFITNVPKSFIEGAKLGIFVFLILLLSYISIPYYFRLAFPGDGNTGNIFYLVLMFIVFWFLLITVLALQWFIPVKLILKNNFFVCIKKSYILFFDNTLFTIGLGINNLFLIILSVVTLSLFPGISGILLTNTNALRLRMYKYDWLEVNPDLTMEQKKDVPWDELLKKDRKTLGPRKLKSFLFPWKQ